MTATPEIAHTELTSSDAFLVLASDGIFDVLSNADVVEGVLEFLAKPGDDTNAATYLIRLALEEGKGQAFLSSVLTMQSPNRRRWRDDMTVQVVFFKTDLTNAVTDKDCPMLTRCS